MSTFAQRSFWRCPLAVMSCSHKETITTVLFYSAVRLYVCPFAVHNQRQRVYSYRKEEYEKESSRAIVARRRDEVAERGRERKAGGGERGAERVRLSSSSEYAIEKMRGGEASSPRLLFRHNPSPWLRPVPPVMLFLRTSSPPIHPRTVLLVCLGGVTEHGLVTKLYG